jgi:hypothetical protein
MPTLNKIIQSDSGNAVFLALGLDNPVSIMRFQKDHIFDYAVIPDAGEIHKNYNIFTCPVSMVIDKEGILRYIQENGINIEMSLTHAIKMLRVSCT